MIMLPIHVPVLQAATPGMQPLPKTDTLDGRRAVATDAPFIHDLIARYQQAGHLLPRSLGDIATHASRFVVAIKDGTVLACAELAPLSRSVAEVRSLVVDEAARGLGVGRMVIDELRRRARGGHYRTLCAFTHDPRFFVRLGFSIVPHFWLPEKVSADCWSCALFQKCGQYAMVDTQVGRFPTPATTTEIFS
ncbi:MAG: GNAT family N-acetyltransferase [Acidobacteria bacterium]|nr:GNAT family N-acetyltransferase [Acidobacteriota bacterium]